MIDQPQHIAIIMDGNGRWAAAQGKPRIAGHKAGLKAAREVVRLAAAKNIPHLTLFAFSQENWQRPRREVQALMELFATVLQKEVKSLSEQNIRLHFLGDVSGLQGGLSQKVASAQAATQGNTGMQLNIALNYSGRWDIVHAAQRLAQSVHDGTLASAEIDEACFARFLSTDGIPEPDLMIRTSGEQRISNFLLWQLAYSELYFSDCYWPQFNEAQFDAALAAYRERCRRFGLTTEQLEETTHV